MPLLDANIPVPDFEAHRFDCRRFSAVSTSHDWWVTNEASTTRTAVSSAHSKMYAIIGLRILVYSFLKSLRQFCIRSELMVGMTPLRGRNLSFHRCRILISLALRIPIHRSRLIRSPRQASVFHFPPQEINSDDHVRHDLVILFDGISAISIPVICKRLQLLVRVQKMGYRISKLRSFCMQVADG